MVNAIREICNNDDEVKATNSIGYINSSGVNPSLGIPIKLMDELSASVIMSISCLR